MSDWRPTATLINLHLRAKIINRIRHFFTERNMLEVETPLLSHSTIPDPHIESFTTHQSLFLQTSPEFSMKRLLASGSGDIYQLCKAFRNGERGNYHNPEFTLLEWYRIGYNHHHLMTELDEFLQFILDTKPATRSSYQTIFQNALDINPHLCTMDELKQCASKYDLNNTNLDNKDDWLNLLLTHLIEPKLGRDQPEFIYDYPASQASLAKICNEPYPVAERFECYYQSIELANGFHELTNPDEQYQRFVDDNKTRKALGLQEIPLDENLLAALKSGLPECSGVALGVDRLMMLATQSESIDDVLTFNMENA